MNKTLYLIIGMVMLIGIASAGKESLGVFKQNEIVRVAQICDDATNITITSISYPNGSVAVSNKDMTPAGNGEFYYDFTNTSNIGIHDVRGIGDGCEGTFTFWFEITYTGEAITIQQSYIYIIALVFLVLLLFGTFFLINKLPSKDATDEAGTIIEVSMLKHLRKVLWVFIWGISMVIMFVISNLGIAYLKNQMIGNLFFVIYRIQFYVLIIGTPIYFVWIFYKIFKDKEMKRLMTRGVEFGGRGL